MQLLLIITGGIAAYKTPELVRRLRDKGVEVTCVLTESAARFVSPFSLSAVSEQRVYSDLWNLEDEHKMGHIRLSREADAIFVAPASADFLAKLASGHADDLASALLLASDKPATIAPAMNHRMWRHPATQRNLNVLRSDGHSVLEPEFGSMACGEYGPGKLPDVPDLVAAVLAMTSPKPLQGLQALITTGPTLEALDPVRYISNYSSGKQGHALATALVKAGAGVTLVSGPTSLTTPQGVRQIDVFSAADMLSACEASLPVDILVCAAAVADYAPTEVSSSKIKKNGGTLRLNLSPTPDILQRLCAHASRPTLTIGFAAETSDLEVQARSKRTQKGCDWLLANDVGARPDIFGGDKNQILFLGDGKSETWPLQPKIDIASTLVKKIIAYFS